MSEADVLPTDPRHGESKYNKAQYRMKHWVRRKERHQVCVGMIPKSHLLVSLNLALELEATGNS